MFRTLAHFIDRRRRLLLAVVAITTVAAACASLRMQFDFRPQALFASNDELVRYGEELRAEFGYEDAIVLILAEATGDHDALDRRLLTWQGRVGEELAALADVDRVDSVARMQQPRPRLLGPTTLAPLIQKLPVDEASERRVRAVLAESRLVHGALLSSDQRLGVIAVTVSPPSRHIGPMSRVMSQIDDVLARHALPSGYRLHVTGLPAIRVDIVKQMQRDQATLLPAVSGMFLIVLLLVFRNFWAAVVPLLAIGVGTAWTVGALSAMGQSFNLISNVLPLLLLVIGVSNSVHIVSRYLEERNSISSSREAAKETLVHMSMACLLASLTTAIGFFSIVGARSEVLQAFGAQAAAGMGLLFVSTIVVLGVALPWVRPNRRRSSNSRQGEPAEGRSDMKVSPATRLTELAGMAVVHHPWTTLFLSLACIAVSLFLARGVHINSYLIETYDPDHPTIQTLRLAENRLSGVVSMEISLDADHHDRFLDPENFRAIHEFQQGALAHRSISYVRSYVDVLQEAYRRTRRSDEAREQLPSLDAQGRKRIEFSERMVERFGEAFDYRSLMNEKGTRARIVMRTEDAGTRRVLRIIDELEERLEELLPESSGIRFRLTGDAYVSAKSMDRFIRDLLYSFGGAAVVIFVIIALLFRSPRLGAIAALPNLTPIAITLGYMGWRGYEMNAANAIVFSISLGIAVDDTIHFLARYREEIAKDISAEDAIQATLRGTGKAILLTTFLIISGLSILNFSEFVPSRRVAELISVSMLAALVGDLLLLPACLYLFGGKRRCSTPTNA